MTSTLTHRDAEPAAPIRLLSYVLDYDDLKQKKGDAFDYVQLGDELSIERADGRPGGWSDDERKLRLADGWLSLPHARIVKKREFDLLYDADSKNGTFVNGRLVREHILTDSDLIEVGHSLLCYRVVDPRLAKALADTDRSFGPTRTLSPEVAMLLHNLRILATSGRPVLLMGETGTGKELAAKLLHEWSGRQGPYVTVDCGAVPDSLFEARFFGYVRGAFTGATSAQQGEICRADRGTLFLDEIGNLSEAAQAKLLRVMQDGCVTPLGTTRGQQVNVRWLAATNAALHDGCSAFRRDLLRRLGTVQHLPPLRQRREDLGSLCAYFLSTESAMKERSKVSITLEAGRRLFSDALPGNLRQLREVLLSAALLAVDEPIADRHLLSADPSLATPEPLPEPPIGRNGRPSSEALEEALCMAGGNKTKAAHLLGTSVRQLYRWLKRPST